LSNNNTLEASNISKGQRGIFLYQSNYTKIANCTIMDEERGGIILDQYCTGNTLASNIISNSTEGINISGGSLGNTIFRNDLSTNVQPAWDFAVNSWDRNGSGNFYGQKDCRDLNNDGICDLPYLIAGGSSIDRYPLVSWTRMPG
jgi:parallel beta-helix repeat protein